MMERAVQKMVLQGVTVFLTCGLLVGGPLLYAQGKKTPAKKAVTRSGKTKTQKPAASKAGDALEEATKKFKEDLEAELQVREANVRVEEEKLAKQKLLYQSGISSKLEVEKVEADVASARAELNQRKQMLEQAENILAEAQAMEKLLTMPAPRIGSYTTTAALIRYAGPAPWALENIARVSSFFVTNFKRQLPISAFGQSAVHDRMRFDHRNSVDVALHPDSAEGQALLGYLRSQGIPFLAFRAAVPGAATGAHIHIGLPSHRIR